MSLPDRDDLRITRNKAGAALRTGFLTLVILAFCPVWLARADATMRLSGLR
jgi:hypothetical protein